MSKPTAQTQATAAKSCTVQPQKKRKPLIINGIKDEKVAHATSGETDAMLLGRTIGQIEAFNAVADITSVGSLLRIKEVKERGAFRSLTIEVDGEVLPCSNFKDFCKHYLARSYDQIRRDLEALESFGENVFESMKSAGISYNQLSKLRTIDEEETIKIQEAVVNAKDSHEIKALVENLIDDHSKTKRESEAKDSTIQKLEAELQNEQDAHRVARANLKGKRKSTWSAPALEIRALGTAHAQIANEAFDELEHLATQIDEVPKNQTDAVVGNLTTNVRQLYLRARALVEKFPTLVSDMPLEAAIDSVEALEVSDHYERLSRAVRMEVTHREQGVLEEVNRGKRGRPKAKAKPKAATATPAAAK